MNKYSDETMQHFNNITVRELDWSVRTRNLLSRHGYINSTVTSLYWWIGQAVNEKKMLSLPGIGWRAFSEIQEGLCTWMENHESRSPAIKLTEANATKIGTAIGNSMAGNLFLGHPFEIGLFEKELNDIRVKNGWKIIIEFAGVMIVTVFDKETGKKLAETGATSLLGILWALQKPLDSNNWYKL